MRSTSSPAEPLPRVVIGYATTIATALPVPGAMDGGSIAGPAAITIVEGRCGPVGDDWATLGPYRAHGDTLVFDCPGIGRYRCEGGADLTVEPAPGADRRTVSEMLIATALPGLLWSRGAIMLHASAAVLDGCDTAIAITGPSGAGKSTILDALVRGGAAVVADDSVRIGAAGDGVAISGLPASYFLPAADGAGARVVRPVAPAQQRVSAPLGALLVLSPPHDDGPAFRRLTGIASIEALIAGRHRPRIARILGREAGNLAELATIARRVPVYAWQRRAGAPQLDDEEQGFLRKLGPMGS